MRRNKAFKSRAAWWVMRINGYKTYFLLEDGIFHSQCGENLETYFLLFRRLIL
jgi:hypothetical protein